MKKPSILICDDEQGVRESLKVILEKEYQLGFATSGKEALECVAERSPDLVIMDIKMPKVSGLEILREVKRLKPDLRVLMITGYESTGVATQAVNLGADGYLTKPFDEESVLRQVERLLGNPGG